MSDDKIRKAILDGLHQENPLASLFAEARHNRQVDWIMDELKSVLPAHRFNEGDSTSMTPQEVGWREAYNQLCADLAYMLGMEDASIAGDHQVKEGIAEMQYSMKCQTFAVLWHEARAAERVLGWEDPKKWLADDGFKRLFPDHCIWCHGFENGPCDDAVHTICPACVQDEGEGQ